MNTTVTAATQSSQPPKAPGGLPYVGHMLEFGRTPLAFIDKTAKLGAVVELKIPGRRAFQLQRAEDVAHVLTHTNDEDFAKFDIPIATLPLTLGEGLFTAKGELWARQRRMMQPAFHRQRIEAYSTIMVERTAQMLASWRAGESRDLHEEMMKLTLEIVCDALFGTDTSQRSEILGEALNVLVQDFVARSSNPLQFPPPIPTPRNRRLKQALQTIESQLFEIVDERHAKGNLEERSDLLSMLLLAQDDREPSGRGTMSDKQLRDEIVTLFIAGHETTALALGWAFYLLAQHPDIDLALASEMRQTLGDRPPTLADLPNLKAAERVLKESMRLYPPVWSFANRLVLHDCELSGYRIPKESVIFIHPWALHRSADYFSDPLTFHPERWTEEFSKALPKYAYFPFGAGPRVCIGIPFAMLEATLALAMISRDFRLELVDDKPVELLPSFTLRPKQGIWLKLVKRAVV